MQNNDRDIEESFGVPIGNAQSQATVMTIPPGACHGGPNNRHREADQWLFVVDGSGIAIVDERRTDLSPGALLLIEAGNAHEIRNTGTSPLKTINVYVPPAYDRLGNSIQTG